MKQLTRTTRTLFAVVALFALSAIPALAAEVVPADPPAESLEVMLATLTEAQLCPVEVEPGDEEAGDKCATTPAAVGDPLCADGGTKCKNPGASCKLSNGTCGTCHHVITSDATGHRCRGCTCF